MSLVKVLNAVLVCLCGLLVACSSTGRNYTDSRLIETLDIEIMPDTSKMFVYRLRQPDGQPGEGVHIERSSFGGGDRGPRGGIDVSGSTPKRLEENVTYVVQQMGYCRDGFLVIDSSISRFNMWLKGECREGATDEDRKRFGTKQTLPVKLAN